MRRRLLPSAAVVAVVTLALTLHGPSAYAEDPLETADGVLNVVPGLTVHPKRPGYLAPVDSGANGVPDVAIQEVPGAAGAVVDAASGVIGAAAGAIGAAGAYTTHKVVARVYVENERSQRVYTDQLTFRFRRSDRDGAISAITLVPEESFCKTEGGLSTSAFRPVTETCWYELGTIGPESFSFSSGSRFASYLGPVRSGTHAVGEHFVTRRNGSHEFASETTVNGEQCATASPMPPGWTPYCDSHVV